MFRQIDKPRRVLQPPFDVAVVVPTVLRPDLARAIRSIYAQDFDGRVQILLGIDEILGDPALIGTLAAECPASMDFSWLDPGYSTSVRHGGLYPNRFSGALRTILTYLANSQRVAYLDDDNWWAPDHLSSLLAAVDGADWAYGQRWMVDPRTLGPICIDDWESVGPDRGMFAADLGGFVDTNSLLIDKLACEAVLPLWGRTLFSNRADGEDRVVFHALRTRFRGRATGIASTYYLIDETDMLAPARQVHFRRQGYDWADPPAPAAPPAFDLPTPEVARSRRLTGLLNAVRRQAAAGDWPAAYALIERLLVLAPGNRAVLRQMGRLCIGMGQTADARAIFEVLRAEDPSDRETLAAITALDASPKLAAAR